MLKTIQFFDRVAKRDNWQSFSIAEQEVLGKFLDLWSIQPGETILEPGCGTGRLTRILADKVGSDGQVVACDPSGKMIEKARRRMLGNQVHFHNLPLEDFLLPLTYFDKVICLNCYPHFFNADTCLRRISRTLKEGGQFWICHTAGRVHINRLHQDGPACIRNHQIPTMEALEQQLQKQGFRLADFSDSHESFWIRATR